MGATPNWSSAATAGIPADEVWTPPTPPRRAKEILNATWKEYVFHPETGDSFEVFDPRAPQHSGLYFLWSEGGTLLYVGLSVDVLKRICQHWRKRAIPFKFFSSFEIDMAFVGHIEVAYIYALTPPYNVLFAPRYWAGHDRMVRLIQRVWRGNLRKQESDQR